MAYCEVNALSRLTPAFDQPAGSAKEWEGLVCSCTYVISIQWRLSTANWLRESWHGFSHWLETGQLSHSQSVAFSHMVIRHQTLRQEGRLLQSYAKCWQPFIQSPFTHPTAIATRCTGQAEACIEWLVTQTKWEDHQSVPMEHPKLGGLKHQDYRDTACTRHPCCPTVHTAKLVVGHSCFCLQTMSIHFLI